MSKPGRLSGMLVINKPNGMVSKDVSRYLTRKCGKSLKLGHVGTLDPAASGVLPILIGSATRLQDFLLDLPKTYLFDVKFGQTTDTLDWTGEVIEEKAAQITPAIITNTLPQFHGDIVQIPPVYSAVKYQGRPLYKYAREGQSEMVPLEALSRKVKIHQLDWLGHEDEVWRFRVTCSKGTYVRVLAADLAEAMGTVGMVVGIHREQAAGVSISESIELESINDISDLARHLIPVEQLHLGIPNWRSVAAGWTSRLLAGQKLLVRTDHFTKTLKGEFQPLSPVFLLDEQGSAFGLGVASPTKDGCIQISMKRGL